MRREIERAIEDALHPRGMSTHDGKAQIRVTTLNRLLASIPTDKSCAECTQLRDLLRDIKSIFAGEASPNWVSRCETTLLRGHYLDRIDWALNRAACSTTCPEKSAENN